ncbi:MAG: hypothetical protein ACJ76V_15410 [Thermoleophilaceae bacterium]
MLKRHSVLVAAIFALAVLAPTASADPVNAKNSLVLPANCGGQTVSAVVNGNGRFSPAHILGSTSVFVPQALNITTQFTPTGGSTQTQTNTAAKSNPHGALVTCTFDVTAAMPGGTFRIFGSATGFFTPAR